MLVLLLSESAKFEVRAEIKPMSTAAPMETKPAAGVIPTKPTTAPIQAPKAEIFFPLTPSKNIQVSIATAEAALVFIKARVAVALAASEEPALNPNQPNHKRPVPKIT